jgi:hypothetical protein
VGGERSRAKKSAHTIQDKPDGMSAFARGVLRPTLVADYFKARGVPCLRMRIPHGVQIVKVVPLP